MSILLDASGSQVDRQHEVATQGYIIAEALAQAYIAYEVTSFNNLFDYTIIKKYKDFGQGSIANRQIFKYMAEGSNRDGLAISTLGKLLFEREEEHKVLIVLSDGKPNDERIRGTLNISDAKTKSYVGKEAIEDTARQVRQLRSQGIAVLGVFTGKEEDLEAEKKIFGKDFANIGDIRRFSDVVGLYLKRQIRNILDNF